MQEMEYARKSLPLSNLSIYTFCLISVFFLLFHRALSHPLPEFCSAGVDAAAPCCGSPASLLPKILIKGGTVVNAHHLELADVYIEDGIIVSVGRNIMVGGDVTVIDVTGNYVMPGGIDPHTHLAMEFMGTETIDDFFSGQAAALAGGTTMHVDFVIPVDGSLATGYKSYLNKAKISCMDYGFHMAITKFDEVVAEEMDFVVKEKGINSFKFFLAYKGSLLVSDELLLQGLIKCKSLGALAMVHAENGDGVAGQMRILDLGITGPEGHELSRPLLLEGEATVTAIWLASFVNTPLYVVHAMSIDAMEEIANAQKSGQSVIGEPVVSCVVLNDSWLWHPDSTTAANYVVSPPRRSAGHDKALQAALSRRISQGVLHGKMLATKKKVTAAAEQCPSRGLIMPPHRRLRSIGPRQGPVEPPHNNITSQPPN